MSEQLIVGLSLAAVAMALLGVWMERRRESQTFSYPTDIPLERYGVREPAPRAYSRLIVQDVAELREVATEMDRTLTPEELQKLLISAEKLRAHVEKAAKAGQDASDAKSRIRMVS